MAIRVVITLRLLNLRLLKHAERAFPTRSARGTRHRSPQKPHQAPRCYKRTASCDGTSTASPEPCSAFLEPIVVPPLHLRSGPGSMVRAGTFAAKSEAGQYNRTHESFTCWSRGNQLETKWL